MTILSRLFGSSRASEPQPMPDAAAAMWAQRHAVAVAEAQHQQQTAATLAGQLADALARITELETSLQELQTRDTGTRDADTMTPDGD